MDISEKISTLQFPEPIDAANELINGIAREDIITLHVSCTITYKGRAESEIEPGERTVLIKPDGTVLVHGDEKYQPINWQSPGATVKADLNNKDQLVITAEDDEYLEITCLKIYNITFFNNTDTAELQLKGTEEEMHHRILNNPDIIEHGLHSVEHEKEFTFGRVDVFGYDSEETPVIIEVKRRSATRDHVYQLYTYIKEYKENYTTDVRGILVAPSCTDYIYDVITQYDLEFAELDPLEK